MYMHQDSMDHKSLQNRIGVRVLLGIILCMMVLSAGCQTFPKGEHVSQLYDEEFPSVDLLYTCYSLCLAVWRERDAWRDTGWDLDYFSHEPTNTLGLAVRDGRTMYLVFRSSQAPEVSIDAQLNYQIRLTPLFFTDNPQYKAHKGMLSRYEGVYDEVHDRVREFEGDCLFIIGHSAGGMVATIAFFDLYHAYPKHCVTLVTFGTPRVLNIRAAQALEEAHEHMIRVVMGRDFFASIPPALFGYRHAGRLIRIGSQPFWKIFSIKDHYPGYQHELQRLFDLAGQE